VSRRTIDDLLAAARVRLRRLDPEQAQEAVRAGAVLLDIRSEVARERDGVIPGAAFHRRSVLEWRLDPDSGYSDPALADPGLHVILVCEEGYSSSLAAATLQDLGFSRATDLIGGFEAWRDAGLPVEAGPPAAPR
jgi:rhodanese-related sulfurtransferase